MGCLEGTAGTLHPPLGRNRPFRGYLRSYLPDASDIITSIGQSSPLAISIRTEEKVPQTLHLDRYMAVTTLTISLPFSLKLKNLLLVAYIVTYAATRLVDMYIRKLDKNVNG